MRQTAVIAIALCLLSTGAAQACRLALALALDVSGSVDADEYRLQMSGLANALGSPDVEAALFAIPDAPVALSVFEWSSSDYQRIVQSWVLINDRDILDEVRANLYTWERQKAPEATGLGSALLFAKDLFQVGPKCWKQTLDVSGDGKNNDWPTPMSLRADGQLDGMRINALAITKPQTNLESSSAIPGTNLIDYFKARVIQGPDAFVEVARGFGDYAEAMRRKLLRELETLPVGALPRGNRTSFDPAPTRIARTDQ